MMNRYPRYRYHDGNRVAHNSALWSSHLGWWTSWIFRQESGFRFRGKDLPDLIKLVENQFRWAFQLHSLPAADIG